jgi:hypothetical protein
MAIALLRAGTRVGSLRAEPLTISLIQSEPSSTGGMSFYY